MDIIRKSLTIKKRFFTFFVLVLMGVGANTKLQAQGGLTFISNDRPKNERTSYRVFEDAMRFEKSLEVSFQMSFYSMLYIGEIFSLKSEENDQEYSIYYKYTYNENNTSFIQINRVGEEKLFEKQIPENLIVNGNWIDVNIIFDFQNDKITFSFNGEKVEISEKFDTNGGKFDLIFGKHSIYVDVPSFKIRDLRINSPKKKIYFPLNQREGNEVYDKKLSYKGFVTNPYWLIGDFYHWKKIKEFNLSDASDITFNNHNSTFYFLADTYLLKYNILRDKLDTLSYTNPPKFLPSLTGKAIIDHNTNSIYLYKSSMKEIVKNNLLIEKLGLKITGDTSNLSADLNQNLTVARLSLDNLKWEEISSENIYDQMRFHNNSIYLKETNKLLLFGGYSNFKYHNDFIEYDINKNKITEINFKGDKISPRFFSGLTQIDSNKLLIYGGVGNLSGEEHIGKKYFNDLYEVDLENKVIHKKWSKKSKSFDSASSENLVLSSDKESFYQTSFAENILNTTVKLKKVNIETGELILMGDSISFRTNKFPNEIDFYQLKNNNRLVLYKKEFLDNMMRSSKVSIYTLEFEPVTFEEFNKGQAKFISFNNNQLIIYISILAILILFSVFYFKKFYKRSKEDSYNYLFVRADRQNIKLFISDIWAVEALKDYIKIVCKDKNYIVHNNLSKFIQKLPQEDFIQIHRSYVVNIEKITSIKGDLIYLEKKYYKVGGKYIEQLKGRFDLK